MRRIMISQEAQRRKGENEEEILKGQVRMGGTYEESEDEERKGGTRFKEARKKKGEDKDEKKGRKV